MYDSGQTAEPIKAVGLDNNYYYKTISHKNQLILTQK